MVFLGLFLIGVFFGKYSLGTKGQHGASTGEDDPVLLGGVERPGPTLTSGPKL